MAFTRSTTDQGSVRAPVTLDLPEPVSLRRMLGPGIIAVGIGMAAGELILWPYITALAGFGLLWLALATLAVQFVINMEIERYTLATGQTVVAGLARWWKGWGIFICVAGAFQYMWPGWATSASTVLTFALGGGSVTWITIAVLVVIGIVLTTSPVIYGTVEKIEWVKVGLTLVFLVVVLVAVLAWRTWTEGASAIVTDFGRLPGEVSFTLMLSAIGAAGAGGVHNLILSNWIRDKRYGMGAHVPRLVSPITGTEEAGDAGGGDYFAFPQDESNLSRWKVWWQRANLEHFVTFFLVCLVTITVMSMLAYQTLFGREGIDNSPAFLQLQAELLGNQVGTWVQILFYALTTVSLYATALGLLDVIGRLGSDFIRRNYLADSTRWTESRLYVLIVWAEIVLGSLILLSGITQPLVLLVISTCAASIVTLFYSILIVRLNIRDLPDAIRLRGARLVGMIVAICFYGFLAVGLLVTQLQKLRPTHHASRDRAHSCGRPPRRLGGMLFEPARGEARDMRAVALVAPGRVEIVDDWPEPEPGSDDVVVQIRGVGLCGSDLSVYDGTREVPGMPWVFGHEGGGDIVAVGPGVTHREIGQRVVIEPNFADGTCAACLAGHTSACDDRQVLAITRTGILAERVAVPADYTWPISSDWPDVALACVEPLVVAHTAVRRADVPVGADCLVIGAGSQGQLVCQSLLAAGAQPYVLEPHPGRLELAMKLGAKPAEEHDGDTYPLVFETAGVPAVWEPAYNAVAKTGKLVVIGFNDKPAQLTTIGLVQRQITIVGQLIYDHPVDFQATLAAVTAGQLAPEQTVQATYSVEETAAALASVREIPGKSWIEFSSWRDAS